ncbi:MAG: hypothetical protein SF187_11810 [Deltaproteobacteria bacterium]|nr:hypothetical protein [Deltaproteobacteria bacterium]
MQHILFPRSVLFCAAFMSLAACAASSSNSNSNGGEGGEAVAGSGGALNGPSNGGANTAGAGGTTDAGMPNGGGGGPSAGGAGMGGNAGGNTGGASSQGGSAGRNYSTDPASFLGESRCGQSGLKLCDGFEGAAIDTAVWQLQKQGTNVVELVSDEHARGNKSVHIRANNGFGNLRTTKVFPMPNNTYWARMFVKVKRFSTVDWAHWTMAEATGAGDGSLIRVGGQYNSVDKKNRWGVGSDGGPTGDWTRHDKDPNGAPVEPAVNRWVCLEWLHDGKNNVTRFFVDAQEHPSLATSATNGNTSKPNVPYVLPMFASVWFGWWQYQADAVPFDLWIDELAIDGQRIGCTL